MNAFVTNTSGENSSLRTLLDPSYSFNGRAHADLATHAPSFLIAEVDS